VEIQGATKPTYDMKKLILLLFIPLVLGCGLSTEELAEQVEQNIIETLAENDDWADVELVDFSLVHKGGNEYKGIIELIIENPVADLFNTAFENDYVELKKNIEVSYPVEVIYDGTTFTWEIITE
jgi:hypothetical protein